MEGENTARKNMEMLDELEKKVGEMDMVVIGGPTNSLVRHGKKEGRGFGGERQVRIEKKRSGEEVWKVTYHMTDPAKINMIERSELVERFVDMTEKVKNLVGDRVTVVHVTMFPRFTKECCRAHMAEEDVWLLDGLRRDVNKEIVDGLKDKQTDIKIMEW
jgi:hypothetical protein